MGLLWSVPPSPQAKAGPLNHFRGMVPACWLGTDARCPHFYSLPTCLFTQFPFTPPALASQPQGPKPLTHLFLTSWSEQVAVTQGYRPANLWPPSPLDLSWLACVCDQPTERRDSTPLSCGLLPVTFSKSSDLSWPSPRVSGKAGELPSWPSTFLNLYLPLALLQQMRGKCSLWDQGASLCLPSLPRTLVLEIA